MNAHLLLRLLLALFYLTCFQGMQFVFREKVHFIDDYKTMRPGQRVSKDSIHRIDFVIKYRNIKQLEEALTSVSNPHSSEYRKHWTRSQIAELTADKVASRKVVKFFEKHKINIIWRSAHEEHITAEASIDTWETILNTKFYSFQHILWKSTSSVSRALEYSLPVELHKHVEWVFNVIDFPPILPPSNPTIRPIPLSDLPVTPDEPISDSNTRIETQTRLLSGYVTPGLLNRYYSVITNLASTLTSQAVFASLGQTFSPRDLTSFQTFMNIPSQSIAGNIGLTGRIRNTACSKSISDCMESNLDFQYLTSMAQSTNTYHIYYENCDYINMLQNITNRVRPPAVVSISYGGYGYTTAYVAYFNMLAIQAGLLGITLVVASGDDGVANFGARNKASSCAYVPSFPALSPYVLAVGATQGPEKGSTEIVCSYATGGSITSGGGFSQYDTIPSWQKDQITKYFASLSTAPVSGYATNGRGYPDLSLVGSNYLANLNGSYYVLFGTSASTPAIAGMITLINSVLVGLGQNTVGFLNPTLYAYSSYFIKDIITGNNKCTASATCCNQGFSASNGWDPVTGLGVPSFTLLLQTMIDIGKNRTTSPTMTPSVAPTTSVPSVNPTVIPSTTVRPSTWAPSTLMPITAIPSTSLPTSTSFPSTFEPTTVLPSTITPSTTMPSTELPSTTVPSTNIPTTSTPSTTIPSTSFPSIASTNEPTTMSPTTLQPSIVTLSTITPTNSMIPTTHTPTTSTFLPTTVINTLEPSTCSPTTSTPTAIPSVFTSTLSPSSSLLQPNEGSLHPTSVITSLPTAHIASDMPSILPTTHIPTTDVTSSVSPSTLPSTSSPTTTSDIPSESPTTVPSIVIEPTVAPTNTPMPSTVAPSVTPSESPTTKPTVVTITPTSSPMSSSNTAQPTSIPIVSPTMHPSLAESRHPTLFLRTRYRTKRPLRNHKKQFSSLDY